MPWFKHDKQTFKKEKIKHILKTNYCIPNTIQRDIENDRIQELREEFDQDFEPLTPIYFCVMNKQRYLIDGQHRLDIFRKNVKYANESIWVSEIEVENMEEMNKAFKIINNQLALNDLWKQPESVKQILCQTVKYFEKNYPNTFKFNGRRRPFMKKELFRSQITKIQSELEFTSSEELINRILYINQEYSQQSPDYFPSKPSSDNRNIIHTLVKENCLYLSMVEEWTRHCIENKIPEKIHDNVNREKVWMTYMGRQVWGKCFCCELRDITPFHFEAGHVQSKAMGGSDDIENLRPICSPCNKNMGTENLFEYKSRMFPEQTKN